MKYNIELTKKEIEDLKLIKNYFGANDKSVFEHFCYKTIDSLISKFNSETEVKDEVICPKCENEYPHLLRNNEYSCDDCGHTW